MFLTVLICLAGSDHVIIMQHSVTFVQNFSSL